MRIPLFKRVIITFCNIFFPPLAVGLLTGFTSRDTFLNSCLFLLAIIPSHVHGFYISAVYFTRKRRVRNGKWPGKPHKTGVWSEKVLTGGAGWDGAEDLKAGKVSGSPVDGYGSDFDSRRRSKRAGSRRSNRHRESGRSSKRVSQVPSQTYSPYEAQPSMEETQRVTSGGSRVSRASRRF